MTLSKLSITAKVISTSDSIWQECLQDLPHDFYHLPGYLELEANRSTAKPEAIVIRDGSAMFFLPYLVRECPESIATTEWGKEKIYDAISPYGYPGMLVTPAGQNPEFISKCLRLIQENWQDRRICSAFLRLHPLLNNYIDPDLSSSKNLVICEQGDVVVIDLAVDRSEIWRQIRSSHRTKINRLKRNGFEADIDTVDRYLAVFMEIYRETMDRVNATSGYYFTEDYFRGLAAALGSRLSISVVKHNEQIVAASLITEVSGIVQYHLGGTRTEFLSQSPATMMFERTIDWAKDRHNRYLNLGGGLGGSRDSLFHFKSGFSDLTAKFITVKIIAADRVYDRLTELRAKEIGLPIEAIENTSFFPAYRLS
jgi:Acetyltransferase (GNAT) domain